MFSLKEKEVKLNSVNTKPEKHGDEPVPATYLKIEFNEPNKLLDIFDPELRRSLYKKAEQADVDEDHLPSLKHPRLSGPLGFDWEGVGYKATFHLGVSGEDNIQIKGCAIDNLSFEPLDGGTVTIRMRIVCHIDALAEGKLAMMQQREMTLTLKPPTAKELQEMAQEKEEKQAALV